MYQVSCGKCEYKSGEYKNESEAIKTWNTRAGDVELTAYKEMGLTPEQITEGLKYFVPEFADIIEDDLNELKTYREIGTPEKLTAQQGEIAELRAELDKAIELPCEYGVTIYYIHEPNGEIKTSHVIGFYYTGFIYSPVEQKNMKRDHGRLITEAR